MELSALKIHQVKGVSKMKIVCAECLTPLKCRKTGEQNEIEGWRWAGDRFGCEECDGGEIIVLADKPIAKTRGEA